MRPLPLLLAFLFAVPALAQPASPKFVGSWTGSMKQGDSDMEIVLNIAPGDSGYAAYFDVPAQSIRGMQVENPVFTGSNVAFPAGGGRYEGRVNTAGDAIVGKYIAGPTETPLIFRRLSLTPVLPAVAAAVADPDGLAGDFTGRIEAGGGLEASIHLRRTPDGYAATLDIPAQHALGLSADAVTLDGPLLTLTFPFGAYAGTFSADRAALDGTWTQSGHAIPFDLARQPAQD